MATVGNALNEHLEDIADALCGGASYTGTGNRLNDSVGRIAKQLHGNPISAAKKQEASTAADVAGLKADLNSLIAKLKDAGLMEGDAFTLAFADVTDSVTGRADRQYNTDQITNVAESDGVITITLAKKVRDLKDFDGLNGWGVHKWMGIGISAGVSPITGLQYNGTVLSADDVTEATQCGLSAGYFVRWVAADLLVSGDDSEKSKSTFTLAGDGHQKTVYTIKIVEP